ncbi:hypothetical protein UFOVP586_1 [uncultured Caudovirales phage]|uniref:Uncharacterized protein n=1 Tax=uncultured Caudovirales phage TaxID=2100421 RepID=A0A6J5MW04_9CAUD|nr:hypothetical protein UFOVP586_1 [uncultured Caudovirales phage]
MAEMTLEQRQAVALARARAAADSESGGMPTARRPDFAETSPNLYGALVKTRQFLGPTVEALGGIGGAALGAAAGPPGAILGGAAGYGLGTELTHQADVALGLKPLGTAAQNVMRSTKDMLTGATFDVGARVAIPYVAASVGKIMDFGKGPMLRAADMLRQSLGPSGVEPAAAVLKAAPAEYTAAQALSGINAPAAQAVLKSGEGRNTQFYTNRLAAQEELNRNALAGLSGGQTQTAARATQNELKNALNAEMTPIRESELGLTNTMTNAAQNLATQGRQAGQAATQAVEDVRRFTAAGERATTRAYEPVAGFPSATATYPYMEQLSKAADDVATQAAAGSLKFGEVRNLAEGALAQLKASGLEPLTGKAITDKVVGVLKDPQYAGNDAMQRAVTRFASDVNEWSNNGGIIDAFALDSLRKNSVNAAIRDLMPNADAKEQARAAAGVMTSIKPVIVDAIERAGGAGYGEYLRNYADAMQGIAKTKLSAKALDLFKNSPDMFVKLVNGDDPKLVEKILGTGKFNLADELGADAMAAMRNAADTITATKQAGMQAEKGAPELQRLLKEEVSSFRLPSLINAYFAAGNKAISILENAMSKSTMKALEEGARNGKNTEQLLRMLPAKERIKALDVLYNAAKNEVPESAQSLIGYGVNALTPKRKQNNLRP